jgi:DNA-binding NtrC family response regulator
MQNQKVRILCVDDDSLMIQTLEMILRDQYDVSSASSAKDALQFLTHQKVDLILLDVEMPEIQGPDVLRLLSHKYSGVPVIMLTGVTDPQVVVKCLQSGASDYVSKGADNLQEDLLFRIRKALEVVKLKSQNEVLENRIQEENKKFEIIGTSKEILKIKNQILHLKGEISTVLITGESGTGKELIARALNLQEQSKKVRPFIQVNCAAIPEGLAESELFGHEKGSFTGAVQKSPGKFLASNGGDIFLDEIGELPLSLQAKLLRVIQEKVIIPVGSFKEIPISVRIIAATNRNLKEEVSRGRFREDLYYRLSVISLHSPPLRDRAEDVETLCAHFLKEFGSAHVKFSTSAMKKLKSNLWTGNIRALKNCIERARLLATIAGTPIIDSEHIQIDSINIAHGGGTDFGIPQGLLPEKTTDVTSAGYEAFQIWAEKTYLERAYILSGRNKTLLSQYLGRARDTVWRKLRSLHIENEGHSNDTSA